MPVIKPQKDVLIVVDAQNDFIDGVLGTEEAVTSIQNIVNKIELFSGDIYLTQDLHSTDWYENSLEGKYLQVPHCINGTDGCNINDDVMAVAMGKGAVVIPKSTFGSMALAETLDNSDRFIDPIRSITIVGFCTDICVIANAILIKTKCHEIPVYVDAKCCAGTTPEMHDKALDVMDSCQIKIVNR